MKILYKITNFVSRYMAVIAVGVTIFAFFVNNSFTSWVANPSVLGGFINVNHLLMVVMFGMGLTLRLSDFAVVFSHPKDMIIGQLAQDLIMPTLAFLLCVIFRLPTELAVGVILVGCCPGGTSSNVMTYMAKSDVPLSVGMTAVSTLLAPILTPLLTGFYVGIYNHTAGNTVISVDMLSMFLSIIEIVIVPIALGLIFNHFLEKITQKIVDILPLISCMAICIIIGYVIDVNSEKLFVNGLTIILVVILLNGLGYALGFLVGKIAKLDAAKRNAIAIEVGMQNSGMATSLASSCFPNLALATVPGALFSAWHNISGAIVASFMARAMEKEDETLDTVEKVEPKILE